MAPNWWIEELRRRELVGRFGAHVRKAYRGKRLNSGRPWRRPDEAVGTTEAKSIERRPCWLYDEDYDRHSLALNRSNAVNAGVFRLAVGGEEI
jgi:hypothetical protein